QGARLAAELGRLLDQIQIERLSFDRLQDLAPENFAGHWQKTLRFLEILTHHWPTILSEEGRIDQAERRNRIIEAQAEAWHRHPPPGACPRRPTSSGSWRASPSAASFCRGSTPLSTSGAGPSSSRVTRSSALHDCSRRWASIAHRSGPGQEPMPRRQRECASSPK